MDSHAVSYTRLSRRNSSRTYLDLAAFHSNGRSPNSSSSHIMGEFIKDRIFHPATPPHVGIIGAGISGLRCADLLMKNGFRVTILEGRDRIGGRVHQTYIPSTTHLVDVGANWIHGTDHNPILHLAEETQTVTHSWGETINVFDESGHQMSFEEGAYYNEIMWEVITDAFKHSNKNFDSIPPAESLFDFYKCRIRELVPDTEKDYEKKRKTLLQMSKMWGAFVGRTVKEQSLKFLWLEETIEGENLFCAGTYQKILALIAKPALEKATVKFSTIISKINSADGADGKVIVTTDRGKTFQFDEIVVTAPLGWLKKNQEAFTPSLPPRFCSAIESIGYGCLEKVYISFPRAFWLSPSKSTLLHGQSNQDDSDPQLSGFSQFLAPNYAPLNPHKWVQEMLELSTLPGTCAHPSLLFYMFGDQSRAFASELAIVPPSRERHIFLLNFFRPYFSRLPNYSESDPDCIPTSSYATEWLNDDLAGNGSYSNFPIGLTRGDKDIEVMREGLPERGIYFAGEHTAPFVASGTVTGAYWSGENVGRRIAEAYGMAQETATTMPEPAVNGMGHKNIEKGPDPELNVRAFTDLKLEE